MSHIIGRKCVSFCDTGCVKVCPVDCINGPIKIDGLGAEVEELKNNGEFYNLDKPQMYINPDVCIDCGACITECPVMLSSVMKEKPLEREMKNMFIKIMNSTE